MNYLYKVKWCPVCNQGWVEIVKDEESKVLYLCCSECESEWATPEELLSGKAGFGRFGTAKEPEPDEIRRVGWDSALITPI